MESPCSRHGARLASGGRRRIPQRILARRQLSASSHDEGDGAPGPNLLEAEDRQPERALRHVVRLRHRRPEQEADGPRGPLEQRAQRVLVREGDGVDLDVDAVAVEGRAFCRANKARGGRRSNDPRKGRRRSNNRRGWGRAHRWYRRATCRARRGRGRRLRMRVAKSVPRLLVEDNTLKRLGLVARPRYT